MSVLGLVHSKDLITICPECGLKYNIYGVYDFSTSAIRIKLRVVKQPLLSRIKRYFYDMFHPFHEHVCALSLTRAQVEDIKHLCEIYFDSEENEAVLENAS